MDDDIARRLGGLFINTAKAHHVATGGANPQWAEWYAEHLRDDLNRIVGRDMTVAEIADWLIRADARYGEEHPDVSWPKAYTEWLLTDVG